MKIGILADAHGNIDALRACIELLKRRKAQKIIYLGDAIGYFPYSEQVCSLLLSLETIFIEGNHEAIYSGTLDIEKSKRQIIAHPQGSSILREWATHCASIGPIYETNFDERKFLLVHGSPDQPYCGRIEQAEGICCKGYDIILAAHTHRPLLGKNKNGTLLLNPGSCGYPRDNGSLLSLAMLETQTLEAEIIRIPFRFTPQILSAVHPSVSNALRRRADVLGTIMVES